MAPKTFSYKGKEHQFYISLGYAEYPTFASNRSQLMRCADAALYEIKLHGKNGCMAYKEGLELRVRKQLGICIQGYLREPSRSIYHIQSRQRR